MAEVKGVLLKGTMIFLQNRFGDQAVEAAIKGLSAEDQKLLPSMLLASNWYSYEVWRAVRNLTRALMTKADADIAVEMGKFNAQYAFTGVYQSVLTDDPIRLLEKFSWIHDFFYKDTSTITTRILGDKSGIVEYRYDRDVRPARSTCASTMGFWMRTLELAGASRVKAAHTKCMKVGLVCCEYRIEWE